MPPWVGHPICSWQSLHRLSSVRNVLFLKVVPNSCTSTHFSCTLYSFHARSGSLILNYFMNYFWIVCSFSFSFRISLAEVRSFWSNATSTWGIKQDHSAITARSSEEWENCGILMKGYRLKKQDCFVNNAMKCRCLIHLLVVCILFLTRIL